MEGSHDAAHEYSLLHTQDKAIGRFWRSVNKMANNIFGDMNIAFTYDYLLNPDIIKSLELESLKSNTPFDVRLSMRVSQGRKAYEKICKQERDRRYKELLKQLSPQENIELVDAPKGWKPLYISCTYKNSHIEKYLAVFGDLLRAYPGINGGRVKFYARQ